MVNFDTTTPATKPYDPTTTSTSTSETTASQTTASARTDSTTTNTTHRVSIPGYISLNDTFSFDSTSTTIPSSETTLTDNSATSLHNSTSPRTISTATYSFQPILSQLNPQQLVSPQSKWPYQKTLLKRESL